MRVISVISEVESAPVGWPPRVRRKAWRKADVDSIASSEAVPETHGGKSANRKRADTDAPARSCRKRTGKPDVSIAEAAFASTAEAGATKL